MREVPTLQGVPIIAVTAFAMVGDRDKILARRFDGYIAKPITPERFVLRTCYAPTSNGVDPTGAGTGSF